MCKSKKNNFLFCCRICRRKDVSSAILYQSFSDVKELLLVGVGAYKAESTLRMELRLQFPLYTIDTKTINHRSKHFKEFINLENPYSVFKELRRDHTGKFEKVKTATCELILQGENIGVEDVPYTAYYAYVSAHFLLDEKECKELLKRDTPEIQVRAQRKEVASRAFDTKYSLVMQPTSKKLILLPSPTWWEYRHFKLDSDEDKGPTHFSSFLNDSALMEIDPRLLLVNHPNIISKSELHVSMETHKDNSTLDVIFPLRDPEDLENMAARKVRVKVGNAIGHMIPSGIMIGPGERPQLYHIQFVMENQ